MLWLLCRGRRRLFTPQLAAPRCFGGARCFKARGLPLAPRCGARPRVPACCHRRWRRTFARQKRAYACVCVLHPCLPGVLLPPAAAMAARLDTAASKARRSARGASASPCCFALRDRELSFLRQAVSQPAILVHDLLRYIIVHAHHRTKGSIGRARSTLCC